MIGLGSNRLSVCRRGGMSVTQAGKGGMEWLAGGRRPRWSSPYSAQATAALNAAFTAAQWPTIRDYGFAHPEIVDWVNASPILYGTLISLGEKPVGIAYSNGNSWINMTDFQSANLGNVEADVVLRDATKAYAICGGDSGYNALAVESEEYLYFRTNQGKFYRYDDIPYDVPLTIVATQSSISVDGVDGYYWRTSGDSARGTLKIYDGRTASGYHSGQRMVGGISRFFINNEAYKLYPVMRNGDAGLYDMVSGNFYANAGTEPFTVGASWQSS